MGREDDAVSTIRATDLPADVGGFMVDDDVPAMGELVTVAQEAHQLVAGLIDLLPHHRRLVADDEATLDTVRLAEDSIQRAWVHLITAAKYMAEVAPAVDAVRAPVARHG